MKAHRKIAYFWVVMLVFAWIAGAQDSKKESQLRTVRGIVTDKSENAPSQQRRVPEKPADKRSTQQLRGFGWQLPVQRAGSQRGLRGACGT